MGAPTLYIVTNVAILVVSSVTAAVLYWRLRRQWQMTEVLRALAETRE